MKTQMGWTVEFPSLLLTAELSAPRAGRTLPPRQLIYAVSWCTPELLDADRRNKSPEKFPRALPIIETGTSRPVAQCLRQPRTDRPQFSYDKLRNHGQRNCQVEGGCIEMNLDQGWSSSFVTKGSRHFWNDVYEVQGSTWLKKKTKTEECAS